MPSISAYNRQVISISPSLQENLPIKPIHDESKPTHVSLFISEVIGSVMTEERNPKSVEESSAAAFAARERRKRKWDQPAESLLSAGIPLPGVFPPPASVTTNPLQVHQAPVISQNSATVVKNYTQPNILDEPIAREIVINDAEPNVRCKLTKRQTQEEIQRATGAVVITRGKYQPPDAFTGSEKPLYLHISAGTHLKDTTQRIIAVDRAAFMVEEILRQGQILLPAASTAQPVVCNGQVPHFLSTSVYLGFEADPSLNVVARIRGPNDQYINHIMNETGAKAVLQGRGSRNFDASPAEATEQPLHLHISSANSRSLEAAIILAENLLDTISAECGASRISSCKVYSAVPPQHSPSKLLPPVAMPHINANSVTLPSSLPNGSMLNYVNPQSHITNYPYPVSNGATCYNGYGGIYPQATPLQQVALALKSSAAPLTPTLTSTSSSVPEKEKQQVHKRKFQELPVAVASTNSQNNKGTELKNLSTMPPPKKLLHMELAQLPPPPPPKFSESKFDSLAPDSEVANNQDQDTVQKKLNNEPVPDTLLKLVEYGDEEEDDDTKGSVEELCKGNLTQKPALKPFWAV